MIIEFEILNTRVEAKNFVAVALIEQFAKRFPDDKCYVLGKAEQISDKSELWCLLYAFNLDDEGRKVFAENLRVPQEVLLKTAEGLRMILN